MSRTLKCDAHQNDDLAQQLYAAWRRARRQGDTDGHMAALVDKAEDVFDSESPDSVVSRALNLCSTREATDLSRWLSDQAMGLSITLGVSNLHGHVQLFAIPVFGADSDIHCAFKDDAGARVLCDTLRASGLLAQEAAATVCTGLTFPLDAALSIAPGQLRLMTECLAAILVSPDDCTPETQDLLNVCLSCGAELVPADANPCVPTIASRLVIGARLLLDPTDATDGDRDDFFSSGMTEKEVFGDHLLKWHGLANSSAGGIRGVSIGAPGAVMDSLIDANLQYLNGALSIEAARCGLRAQDAQKAVPRFVQGDDESEVSLVAGDVVVGPVAIPNTLIALDPQAFAGELQRLGGNTSSTGVAALDAHHLH